MGNKEVELGLMYLTAMLVGVLVLMAIIRLITIVVTRKINTIDDFVLLLFVGTAISIPLYIFYLLKKYFKNKFKKQSVV